MVNESNRSLAEFLGKTVWNDRFAQIRGKIVTPTRGARLAASRFAAECAIEKARRGQPLSVPETALVELATRIPALHDSLTAKGKTRLNQTLTAAMTGEQTLLPVLHLLHTATLQQSRGFDVSFTGLNEATPFDLLITRENATAEVACDAISAEDGRAIHRGVWTQLIDQIDPDLQTWLAAHPGRYLLKMTLPQGLKPEPDNLSALQSRIKTMLATATRADYDEAAVLRLDPLLLAGAQANDAKQTGIMANLRREFGPEAHFSVTEAGSSLAGGSLFIMAARGGAENEVAGAVRRRMAAIAPARLTGARPGILAMFVEDTDQLEWRTLREKLLLEGEARQFLTFPEARPVIAVTCASRYELINAGAPEGDLRFRNPMHPAAKSAALAPAVLSTV
jgi:hypothetical protein